jgi:SSS family solute:Na+ symporter
MITLNVIICYLCLLLGLGFISSRLFRGTSKDYFVASHSIGPFLLLMSVFGTTMTAFALVGSTGKSFERGIGTYGLMASISGLVHAGIFFLIGIRLWAFGKKFGYITQIQFFRSRFESDRIGYLLFPILVLLVVPYLLIGIIGAGKTIEPVTAGAFTEIFTNPSAPQWLGGIPPWLTGLVRILSGFDLCVYGGI